MWARPLAHQIGETGRGTRGWRGRTRRTRRARMTTRVGPSPRLPNQGDRRRMTQQFEVGDKIICTKNSDVQIFVEDEKANGFEENDQVNYTSATDGKHKELKDKKLRTKNERLMNGNLYKMSGWSSIMILQTAAPSAAPSAVMLKKTLMMEMKLW